jgi:hypothetical protein
MRRAIWMGALALAGCATQAKFESRLDSWMGHRESELLASYGPPQSVYTVSDHERVLTYVQTGQIVLPGQNYTTPMVTNTNGYVGGTNYHATSTTYLPQQGAPTVIGLSCTVNFTVVGEIVTRWRWQGNHCVSQ